VLPDFVNKMMEKKLLGNKTKAGFYKTELTPEWKKIRKVIDLKTLEYRTYARPSFPVWPPPRRPKTRGEDAGHGLRR
jgi:3-hydroxyacyl-CoA dehydrogenase